jgi:ribosomal protein S19E (S16A)
MPSGTSYVASNLSTFNDSTIRNNLTWLRKRGFIRKKGSDWVMTPAGTELLDDVKQGKREQIK